MKEGFLIVILSILLVHKSLQMNLYKVCSLPALHPDLKVQFSYALEEEYLAMLTSHIYTAMPHEILHMTCIMRSSLCS